jgi:hypothetical protein
MATQMVVGIEHCKDNVTTSTMLLWNAPVINVGQIKRSTIFWWLTPVI